MSKSFVEAITARRSIYGIGKSSPISDEKIEEIVLTALKHTPSSFNMQSSRAVLLLHEQHDFLWKNIVLETLKNTVEPDKFQATEQKILSFANGYGTVLYFDDTSVVEALAEKFPLYKENFSIWAQQSNGMLQFSIWNMLEAEGLGANLQHYNPLIDDAVKKQWEIPDSWKLIAQMPFGEITAEPSPKNFVELNKRFKVYR